MDSFWWRKKYKDVKDSLFNYSGKEFLIFMFFLALSTAFWFLSTLNDTYEQEFNVEVKIVDVPRDIVITESFPDTVKVVVKDKGFNLLKYYFSNDMRPISLHFGLFSGTKGNGVVTAADIQKTLRLRLAETTQIVSVKADHWDFYYNHGRKKRVPILLDGDIQAAPNYYVMKTVVKPDSATIYAADATLDTISAVYTSPLTVSDVKSALTYNVRMRSIPGTKIEPSTVKVKIAAEQLTEVTLSVPVQTINMPAGMMLKTFPARVDVTVAIGMKRSKSISAEQFSVVADYNDLPADPAQKLKLKIYLQPRGVVKATIKDNMVDYVIEQ